MALILKCDRTTFLYPWFRWQPRAIIQNGGGPTYLDMGIQNFEDRREHFAVLEIVKTW